MLARLRAGALHDRVGVSRSRAGVEDPRCNIVHIERRLESAQVREAARSAAREWAVAAASDERGPPTRRASAVLRVDRAREDARERLVPPWMALRYPELADAIAEDAEELARMVVAVAGGSGSGGGDAGPALLSVSARLEALASQPCPRWHADTVGARCIVTYAGPGTQYVPNARVSRGWDGAVPFVAGVRPPAGPGDAPFAAAAPGDVLLLKGHACPGMMGMGAVHRSPVVDEEEEEDDDDDELRAAAAARLVLTVDDALPSPCDCCPPGGADEARQRAGEAVR